MRTVLELMWVKQAQKSLFLWMVKGFMAILCLMTLSDFLVYWRTKDREKPEIIFEANGVYSCRLQAFLEENSYDYTRLNPLEAEKQLDSLRVRKTDKIDAGKLASSQFVLNRKPIYVQEKVYQNLHDLSRFYQNLTEDIVRTKNRLHKVLQVAFQKSRFYYLLLQVSNIRISCPSSQQSIRCWNYRKLSWKRLFASQPLNAFQRTE